jgi:sigma54-dependent transcription regulator
MKAVELKQKIVEQVDLLDEDQLEAVFEIIRSFMTDTEAGGEIIELSEEQKQSVKMGQDDILAGRYLSQEELDKQDVLWLNEL